MASINRNLYSHIIAILQALLVTFLWSTSFIIIKRGLIELTPITFAGLRYALAFMCFIPFVCKKRYLNEIKNLKSYQWKKLFLLGFVFYALTQGIQFIGLSLLPSVTVSLMLNFTPLIVAILSIFMLSEKPSYTQWIGAAVFIVGIIAYFSPFSLNGNQGRGLAIMGAGVLSNALASILGRNINKSREISPLVVTFVSMGVGAAALIVTGLLTEGFPEIGLKMWGALIWLAAINTAFAFTLWNVSLRTLSAMESSIINGTMLIQIAVLAWCLLGETLSFGNILGMIIAGTGAIIVQLKKREIR